MPLSRSPRLDRRRRTIRESLSVVTDTGEEARISPTRTARNAELPELTKKERGVAYSHSVRGACQQRVVQFIPVRKLSLAGVIAASATVPLLLVVLHYLVFVSGSLDWSGHPMSALLNANSPRSLAAWMCSHLWLLCLGATVLTFRLRKHKLDDYDGEYRLWFWLVFTCLIGSIDSTTRLTELFGAALDRWSQLHVGWSGAAIVGATLATLIGMLGLRLCSELKTVPTSLVLWLVGLVCWAGSAALSQSLFHLDISSATRYWLRASLWLSGLTCIWLCSLFYLRATFMEAQKRFLSRAMASSQALPWRERLREAMPKLPTFRRNQAVDEDMQDKPSETKPKKRVRPIAETAEQEPQLEKNRPREDREAIEPAAAKKRGWSFGLGKLALRPPVQPTADKSTDKPNADRPIDGEEADVDREYGKKSSWFGKRKAASDQEEAAERPAAARTKPQRDNEEVREAASPKRSLRDRLTWKRRELTEQELAQREAKQTARQQAREDKKKNKKSSEVAVGDGEGSKRSWLRMPRPKLPKISLPKPKFPKLKLPSFRLPPPTETDNLNANNGSSSKRSLSANADPSRPLPSTSGPRPNVVDQESDDNNRNLSKAERKRLKRMQREDESDRRAA